MTGTSDYRTIIWRAKSKWTGFWSWLARYKDQMITSHISNCICDVKPIKRKKTVQVLGYITMRLEKSHTLRVNIISTSIETGKKNAHTHISADWECHNRRSSPKTHIPEILQPCFLKDSNRFLRLGRKDFLRKKQKRQWKEPLQLLRWRRIVG